MNRLRLATLQSNVWRGNRKPPSAPTSLSLDRKAVVFAYGLFEVGHTDYARIFPNYSFMRRVLQAIPRKEQLNPADAVPVRVRELAQRHRAASIRLVAKPCRDSKKSDSNV